MNNKFICPQCSKNLKTKPVKTKSGTILVDLCDTCGGVFFDQGEVNCLSVSETDKLLKQEHPTAYAKTHSDTLCPKCGNSLSRYWGEAVPNDVYVLRCPNCSGTWFTPKDLEKFKKAQKTKLDYFKTWKIPLPSLSAVIIPIALIVTLGTFTLISVQMVGQSLNNASKAKELVTDPSIIVNDTKNRAIIVFTTTLPARTELLLKQKGIGKEVVYPVSAVPSINHQVMIPLEPNQTYMFRIRVITGEDSFVTKEYPLE